MERVGFSDARSSGNGGDSPTESLRDKILNALDVRTQYLWLNPNTSSEKIGAIIYSSSSIGAVAKKHFLYDSQSILYSNFWSYPDKIITQTITQNGGAIVGADEFSSIIIPPDSIEESYDLFVDLSINYNLSIEPQGTFIAGCCFGPYGTIFNEPVTLRFPLLSPDFPGKVYTCYAQDEEGGWIESGQITIDSSGNSATAIVNRL